jgi:hypothetical protein
VSSSIAIPPEAGVASREGFIFGAFGPEASIVAVVVWLAAALFVINRMNRKSKFAPASEAAV